MKNIIFITALALVAFGCSEKEDQEVQVPASVTTAFTTQFPKARRVEWSMEKPGEFEVEFKLSGVESAALFDSTGILLETEAAIKEKELPSAVAATLAKDFAGYKFDECEKATTAKGEVTFEMEAKKAKEEYIISFDANGTLLSKEIKKEEKEHGKKGNKEGEEEEQEEGNAPVSSVLEPRFVPQAVRDSFAVQYPGSTAVWGKEEAGFEAEFSVGNVATAVVYGNTGIRQEIEKDIALTNLPAAISETIKRDFSDLTMMEAAEIRLIPVHKTQYEVEVGKGNSHYDLIFDNAGKIVDVTILAPAKKDKEVAQEGPEAPDQEVQPGTEGKEKTTKEVEEAD